MPKAPRPGMPENTKTPNFELSDLNKRALDCAYDKYKKFYWA